MTEYVLYTDGAYSRKRNSGGLAVIVLRDGKQVAQFSKRYLRTTNNRMELLAVIVGLEAINKADKITVYSDSMYVIGCATMGWKRNKNTDLWNRFDKIPLLNICTFKHIKGHSDNYYNNLCDKLAVMASELAD